MPETRLPPPPPSRPEERHLSSSGCRRRKQRQQQQQQRQRPAATAARRPRGLDVGRASRDINIPAADRWAVAAAAAADVWMAPSCCSALHRLSAAPVSVQTNCVQTPAAPRQKYSPRAHRCRRAIAVRLSDRKLSALIARKNSRRRRAPAGSRWAQFPCCCHSASARGRSGDCPTTRADRSAPRFPTGVCRPDRRHVDRRYRAAPDVRAGILRV